ncbi:LysR family transcriptional regulator [Bacillus sp. FJAT-28004]|uniref:LysR family transcriptional regulator n=1 Tax=Bacillus sp. FJAT-28004 TaxID=1679165 RepID=UPI0006B64D0E|nr:LysR family transcriptional regulator [Bacillus sp. FJAT-28004]
MLEAWEGRFFITFAAVLEEKSFSGAADRLGYVQSTVTSHIRHLETTSGKKLFHRLPRGVEPTEAGLQLAPYAYQFIQLGQSLQDALSTSDMPSGIVRIGALESFAISHLPHFLTGFLKQFTKIKLHLNPGLQHDITAQIVNHRADLGIVPQAPERDDLLFTPLIEESLVLICAPALQERFERLGWQSLHECAFISFGDQCIYHTYGRDVLREFDVELADQLSFSSIELIKQTVACGMGIAFVPESNVTQEVAAGTLLSLPLKQELTMTHGIITHKSREPKAAAQAFIQHLKSFYAKV